MRAALKSSPPLIVHLIYRLDFGGLETLLVEIINRMPADKYRHAIICLTDYSEFSKKITRAGVGIYSLHKQDGLGLGTHLKLWQLLRQLRPAILHTYNLATVEYALIAALARVPIRIHAEHGRTASDIDGSNRKHNLLRRLMIPFVDRFVPVSADLQQWLKSAIGVPDHKNRLIGNGVDIDIFRPVKFPEPNISADIFNPDSFVIGSVGRIESVKNQSALIDAFIRLQKILPQESSRLRLAIIGDGPLLFALREKIQLCGIDAAVWMPGARDDIAQLLRTFSIFALPSLTEGTPVSILEAMATGLPVVATQVGGIPEIINDGETGTLIPPADIEALAAALARYFKQPGLVARHGAAARAYVAQHNSMASMLAAYTDLYDGLCATKIAPRKQA